MKVAFVANTSWNIYNFRKGLVHHFIAKGDEVLVLSPKDEYTEEVVKWGVKWIDTPLEGTGINPAKDIRYLRKLRMIFKAEAPKVAFCFTIKSNIYSCLAARSIQTSIICNVSGLGTVFLVDDLVAKFAINLYRIAFRSASFIFFQNEDDQNLFLSKVSLPKNKIGLLPGSGIDLTEYQYSQPNFGGVTKFLMISRLIIEKGVREFAEAASHFEGNDKVSFTLVGRFNEIHSRSIDKAELDTWISKGWIKYLPHTDQIKNIIQDHEVIVLPSYREGTPRTLLEGAASGRALLASNVAGCKEVVEDGMNGFLFEVKDASHLLGRIKLYLSLALNERETMAKNSRQLVERKFDEKLVVESYEKSLHRIK